MENMVGKNVPTTTVPASNGETVSLFDFKGKNVVLYFYPKDMTPGCTTEACDFRDFHPKFKELNTVVLGVSPDDLKSHEKFIGKHELPFILVADTEKDLANYFGVWKVKKMFGKEYMGIERSTFIIDQEGKIVKEWPKVKVKGHVEEVLQYIQENLLCLARRLPPL